MRNFLKGVGLMAAVSLLAACGGGASTKLTQEDWGQLYEALVTYTQAMDSAYSMRNVEIDLAADQRQLTSLRQTVDTAKGDEAAVAARTGQCATATTDICAAVRQYPRDLATATANLGAAEQAVHDGQAARDVAVSAYREARVQWNPWIQMTAMMIIDNGDFTRWPGFADVRRNALAKAQAFVGRYDDLQQASARAVAAFRAADGTITALSRTVVQARGEELPEQGSPQAATASGSSIPMTQTGAAGTGTPLDVVTPLLQLITNYQLEQAKLNADVRQKIAGQLTTFLMPPYECFVAPNPVVSGCPLMPGAGPSKVGATGQVAGR